jgi:hypothetical protein
LVWCEWADDRLVVVQSLGAGGNIFFSMRIIDAYSSAFLTMLYMLDKDEPVFHDTGKPIVETVPKMYCKSCQRKTIFHFHFIFIIRHHNYGATFIS